MRGAVSPLPQYVFMTWYSVTPYKNVTKAVTSDLARCCLKSTDVSVQLRYAVIVRPHDFTFATDHVFVVTRGLFRKKETRRKKGMYIKRHEIWTVVFLKTPVKRLESCSCRLFLVAMVSHPLRRDVAASCQTTAPPSLFLSIYLFFFKYLLPSFAD
jgi:hypothetical protein